MARYLPGQAVVVIDRHEPTYLHEAVVVQPPMPPMRKDSVYICIEGDRMWMHEWQLRAGRLDDGVQRVWISTSELCALVKMDVRYAEHLPANVRAALEARPLPDADTLVRARRQVADALTLALGATTR